jgi:hypothetical protein
MNKECLQQNKGALIHVNIHNERKCMKEGNLEQEIAWKVNCLKCKIAQLEKMRLL